MGGYFHGWRRQFGMVTLLMACVFMVPWMWSFSGNYARMLRPRDHATRYLISTPHNFTLMTEFYENPQRAGLLGWVALPSNPLNDGEIQWSWQVCGFGIGERQDKKQFTLTNITDGTTHTVVLPVTVTFRMMSYWSIVIPLTLLSAYLLLSNPRIAKPKNSDENCLNG